MARRPKIKSKVARPDSLKPKTILPRKPSSKAAWWNILDPRWGQDQNPNDPEKRAKKTN